VPGRNSSPTRYTVGRARPPSDGDFWENYGWSTTAALCFGIGGFGLLQFLIGLAAVPTYTVADAFLTLVMLFAAPLLVLVGVTGFSLALHDVVRHFLLGHRTSNPRKSGD